MDLHYSAHASDAVQLSDATLGCDRVYGVDGHSHDSVRLSLFCGVILARNGFLAFPLLRGLCVGVA